MRLFGLNRRRSQTLLLAIGQLILIAYVFQIAAFDHWHQADVTSIAGIPGSSAHAAVHHDHCHGAPSSCADAGGGFAQISQDHVIRLPAPGTTLIAVADARMDRPRDAFISSPSEPPQSI